MGATLSRKGNDNYLLPSSKTLIEVILEKNEAIHALLETINIFKLLECHL